ncbi:MAG TPA: helix-turn-helix domain-containing protein [Steroidobacteraceae bacterium]|nr:helix-turn-helix domain-containing protein [Steroidobacteraceae bacterium]
MPYPEIVLRTATVLALLALAGLVLAARRRDHTPVLGALSALAVAAFVVTSARGSDDWLGPATAPLTALCVAKAALFWLFARGLFSDEFRVSARHLAVVAATVAWGLWQQLVLMPRVQQGLASPAEQLAAGGFELWVVVLALLALNEAWRGLAVDLLERRRRLRILVVTGIAGFLLAAVVVQTYNLVQGTVTPTILVNANLVLITTAVVAALWHLLQLRTESWLEPEPAVASPWQLGVLESKVLEALQREIAERHVYREEGLTIGLLAARLRTREQVLRRVINKGLGYRNFNDFLHALRIREACERLRRAEDARLPVLSIALGVGYGSIGPFNRAFKARMGMTPTQFRQPTGAAGTG